VKPMQALSVLIGCSYALISFLVTKKFTKKERINEINKRLKELQNKEIGENERVEIIKLFNESLILQMKPVFVTIPIFFFIYFLIPKEIQLEFILVSVVFGLILNILSEIKIGEKNENKQKQENNPKEITKR
jgi:flagellar biogenesis protein FliO